MQMEEPSLGGSANQSASAPPQLSPEAAADVETVAKGGLVQILGQVTHRSLSFFFNAVAFRVLGAAGFGLFRVVAQTLAIGAQLGLLGFHYASLRFIALARARGDEGGVLGAARTALKGAASASALTLVALLLSAEPLGRAFGDSPGQEDRLGSLLRVGALYIPLFATMQVLRYSTQAYKTMVPSVKVGNIIQPILQFVLGVIFLSAGLAVSGAVLSLVVSTGIACVAGVYYLRRILTATERRATPRAEPRRMLRFALPQAGSQLLGLQALGLGVILLGVLSTTRQVGLFAAALALQGPAGVFQAGTVSIWAPMVSDLHDRGEIARLGSLYKTITRWISTFALPISAAMVIKAELFARFFGGEQAVDAAPVVAILALANIFNTCTGPSSYVLTMTGRPGVNFLNSLSAVMLYSILGWAVVPDHGAVGIAWVDAAVAASVNGARVLEARILVGVQPFGRSFLKPLIATIVGSSALITWTLILPERIWLDVVGIIAAAAVYLVTLRRLGMDAEERHIWQLMKSRLSRARA